MPRLTQPLKWHGGKYYLAQEIIKRFPKHTHYVEPYAGGLAVLFAKPYRWIEGHSEVVNDLDNRLMGFWKVLQSPELFPRMLRRLQATPFSEQEFNETIAPFKPRYTDPVEFAVDFFIQYRQSRQALGKDFATLTKTRTRRGMNEQASAWLGAVEGLAEAHERLKRVVILRRKALNVIRSEDRKSTLFYLDPPYLPETRKSKTSYGEFEMTEGDHKKLLLVLTTLKGKFILSGYSNDLYHEVAQINDWACDSIEIDNKASSAKQKEIKQECLWRNF